MKKILFFIFLFLLLANGIVLAQCYNDEEYAPLNLDNFSISSPAETETGKDTEIGISFNYLNEITFYSQGVFTLVVDYGDGSTEEIQISKTCNAGMTYCTYADGCVGTSNGPMLELRCSGLSIPHKYSSAGPRNIEVRVRRVYAGITQEEYCDYSTIEVKGLCSNGVVDYDLGEECDGDSPITKTCADYGYDSGYLECADNCKISTSNCYNKTDEPPDDPGTGGDAKKHKEYPNPLTSKSIFEFLDHLMSFLFKLISSIVVLMILIGAFILTTSGDNASRKDKGKKVIIWALIGFVTISLSRGIVALVRFFMGVDQ